MRLQFSNLATDRCQRHAEATSGGRKTARFDNGDEDRHGFKPVHQALSLGGRMIPDIGGFSLKMEVRNVGSVANDTLLQQEIAMSRISTPATIADAPASSQPLLEAVNKQLGVVPNMFRLVANSPAALEGFLSLSGALAKGSLPAQTRQRIALAVAEV